jgi:hypothetical protein
VQLARERITRTRPSVRKPPLFKTVHRVAVAIRYKCTDREKLNGVVSTIPGESGFDPEGFTEEIRRAMSGRALL